MKRGIRFIYLFRHFNLTPVRNLDCTSSLQPAPVLLHLPVCNDSPAAGPVCATVGRIYKEDHYTLLHKKYEASGTCGFGDFFMFFPL